MSYVSLLQMHFARAEGIVGACQGSLLKVHVRAAQYLVNRKGFPVKHYASAFEEAVLEADINAELEKPAHGSATSTA